VAFLEPGRIVIHDPLTGRLNAKGFSLDGAAFTPDRRHLILTRTPVAQLWRFNSPASEVLPGHADAAWAVAFSTDFRLLASGSDDTENDQTVKLWDAEKGRLLRNWSAGNGTVASFSPDSRVLATAMLSLAHNVRLWDVATGRLPATLEGNSDRVRSVEFNRDGTRLATAGFDRAIRIWDPGTGLLLATLTGH
jgi:WD40 repeat protein